MDMVTGTLGLYSANIINSAATWAEFARYPARYRRSMILIEHGLDAPAPATKPRCDAPAFRLAFVTARSCSMSDAWPRKRIRMC